MRAMLLAASILCAASAATAAEPILGSWTQTAQSLERDHVKVPLAETLVFIDDGQCFFVGQGAGAGQWRQSTINKRQYIANFANATSAAKVRHFMVAGDKLTETLKGAAIREYQRDTLPPQNQAKAELADPVVGEWLWGDNPAPSVGHDWIFKADGTLWMRSVKSGESLEFAKWSKRPNETYRCDKLESDYWAIIDGELRSYDKDGFVRSYKRCAGSGD